MHYELSTVRQQHAAATKRLSEVEAEIASLGANRSISTRQRDQLLDTLMREQAGLENEIMSILNSWSWQQANEHDKMWAQRDKDNALAQRVLDRQQRIAEECEAYQKQVDAVDWSLVSLPDESRREIAREHLARLARESEAHNALAGQTDAIITEALAQVTGKSPRVLAQYGITPESVRGAAKVKGFETKATDRLTKKKYILVTDDDGYTYAMSDVGYGASEGDSGAASGEQHGQR